jgi:hypothetical protein
VLEKGRHVANYSSVKRMSCGTEEQNTAQLWVTLFFRRLRDTPFPGHDAGPPENMTLHGAADFKNGVWIGSVSAASPTHSAHIGRLFKRVGTTLTIG